MTDQTTRLLVTGASGQLGALVISALKTRTDSGDIAALVRDRSKAADLAAAGVDVREGDYGRPETLDAAFAGVSRLLLISSSEVGQRVEQHRNVIEAAVRAKVGLLIYTSVLHADTSLLGLAAEHRETEALIRASGVPFVILRNGWYTENYTASLAPALEHGAFIGSAGEGRIASAARKDYAEAAAVVLTSDTVTPGTVYELAGDASYSLAEFAAEASRQSGKTIPYVDLPEADYRAALLGAGLPDGVASLLADSDAAAAKGALFDDAGELGKLLGRPTTPFAESIASALSA